MTTCKCREHGTNLVMTRTWFDETLRNKIEQGVRQEQQRIIELLEENTGCGYQHRELEKCFCEAIELIKGEN